MVVSFSTFFCWLFINFHGQEKGISRSEGGIDEDESEGGMRLGRVGERITQEVKINKRKIRHTLKNLGTSIHWNVIEWSRIFKNLI